MVILKFRFNIQEFAEWHKNEYIDNKVFVEDITRFYREQLWKKCPNDKKRFESIIKRTITINGY